MTFDDISTKTHESCRGFVAADTCVDDGVFRQAFLKNADITGISMGKTVAETDKSFAGFKEFCRKIKHFYLLFIF